MKNLAPKTHSLDDSRVGKPALTGWKAYAVTAGIIGAALGLRLLVDPIWGDRLSYATFFIGTLFICQFAGLGPFLVSMLAGFALGNWFFVAPRHTFLIPEWYDRFNAAFYFVLSFIVYFFSHRARRMVAKERAARAAVVRLKDIVESSEDAIIGKSLSGIITSWNKGASRLYGYSEAEALGRSSSFLMSPERNREFLPLLDRATWGEHISHFETVRMRKDGKPVEVAISISPVRNSAGQITGVSTIARDIGVLKETEREKERLIFVLQKEVEERREAQNALQQSQENTLRQERLAAVGQLAAGLAHEFNNILTIIQGHASLLLDNPRMDEEAVKSITHITDGVERTAGLVKQMLAFSSRHTMRQKLVRISEVMEGIRDVLSGLLGSHNSLTIVVPPNLPQVLVDPEMLQQILVNLVANAREALGKGGELRIEAREMSMAVGNFAPQPERIPGRFVCLEVRDNGAGIEPALLGRVFEPFFTTKEVGKGSGLGLATVYGMVKQNGGWIEVESKPGKGTSFHIYFPPAEIPAQISTEPKPSLHRGGGESILVVEDDEVLRELVREILEDNGYRIIEAATAQEALQAWENNRSSIDLLLTDLSMPDGLSGRDLAVKLQADNPRLPVIFSSGYNQEILGMKDGQMPNQSFLSKPYHPADLAQAVRRVLDGVAQRDPAGAGRNQGS